MKKQLFNSALSLSVLSALILSSCQDYIPFDENDVTTTTKNKAYTEAFVNAFGAIDANNGFGMDEPLQSVGWGGATRAGNVWVNRNEWVKHEDWDMSKGYATDALAHDIIIPGWPNFDGLYYGNFGGSALQNKWTSTSLPNGAQPCGDVTDYEIQYVSAWFRTHRITDPENYREKLHLSDFFIQNVSCDNDQKEYNTISSTDQTGYNGANVLTGNDQGAYNNINRKNGSHEQVNFSLDQLGFQDMDGNWTHVNNFNNQNSNFNPEEAKSTPNREIKYITSSGTENFRCHPSFSTKPETEWIDSWVLVRLTWEEKVTDTNSPYYEDGNNYIQREGYYLAFDFKANKTETEVSCDGYYSNWIVKITPGHFAPTGVARRIMCEDLGGTFDFDFNDVVVDVMLDGSTPVITVQAAGGTMPIYVDGRQGELDTEGNPKYEAHRLLGANVSQPVNAMKDYSNQHAPAIFRGKTAITILDDLPIYVVNGENTYSLTGNRGNLNDQTNNPYVGEKATEAPRAFGVPTSVKWMKEMTNIEKSYVNFSSWVANAEYTYKPSNDATPLQWYEQSKPQADDDPTTSYVYYPGIQMVDGSPKGFKQTLPAEWQTLTPISETFTAAEAVGALGAIKINGYTGNGSIIDNFTNQGAKQITITVIVKSDLPLSAPSYTDHDGQLVLSNPDEVIQAILIPADNLTEDEKSSHSDATMKYKETYFNKSIIQAWRVAQYQNYDNPNETSQMPDGHKNFDGLEHTYALKMTFDKSQIMQNETKYVDWIHFFIKVPEGKHAAVYNWHVHY